MDEKPRLLQSVTKSIRGKAHKLGAFVTDGLSESEEEAKVRAHLATVTDHAFVGCNPCRPGDAIPLSDTMTNRIATPRPKARDS